MELEKDRMLITKNVPKYSVIGKKYDYELDYIEKNLNDNGIDEDSYQ